MSNMTRYLVRRATGEAWIWTEQLSKRKDLEEVYAESPAKAVEKPAVLDPRNITIAEIESMPKADLIIFGEVKLGLKLDGAETKAQIQDRVKEALLLRPSEGMSVATEAGPFGTAREAMTRSGVATLTPPKPAKAPDEGPDLNQPVRP